MEAYLAEDGENTAGIAGSDSGGHSEPSDVEEVYIE